MREFQKKKRKKERKERKKRKESERGIVIYCRQRYLGVLLR